MKVLICGADGYIGWPLMLYLLNVGHEVMGFDNLSRRRLVNAMGGESAIPIDSFEERNIQTNKRLMKLDLCKDWRRVKSLVKKFKPDVVFHLAEQASAAWSMIDRWHCLSTHGNNVLGTLNLLYVINEYCPETHLIKLGTMGEYGTPNIPILEGFFDVDIDGRKDTLLFPRQPGSWYHLTKVHDSHNIMFACRNWGLRSTDIMQGIVFGVSIDGRAITRFDYDEAFGTVINRFCAQAVVNHPITVYGSGNQMRTFLPLKDVICCLDLVMQNPPKSNEYRILNQFAVSHSINELALKISKIAKTLGFPTIVEQIKNPRNELEEHYYNPKHQKLLNMGYKPALDIDKDVTQLLLDLQPFRDRIKSKFLPKIKWS